METASDVRDPKAVREVILAGLAFGVVMGLGIGITTGSAYYGFHGGFACGFAFGWALSRFRRIAMSTTRLEMDGRAAGFEDGEAVVHHGPANHFKGLEAVGGKLFLTDRRLRFRSHKLNAQTHDESYPLDEIAAAEPARTLGIVPNGVLVRLRDGRHERFVVSGRAAWVARIQDAARAPR